MAMGKVLKDPETENQRPVNNLPTNKPPTNAKSSQLAPVKPSRLLTNEFERKQSSSSVSQTSNSVNVKVVLRCRPLHPEERAFSLALLARSNSNGNLSGNQTPTLFSNVPLPDSFFECRESSKEVVVSSRRSPNESSKTYMFDGVCGPGASQQQLFDLHIVPLVEEVLQGFNCTIFAYGQTGTGKTYTMEGDWTKDTVSEPPTPISRSEPSSHTLSLPFFLPKGVGVIPRAVALIFQKLKIMDVESSLKVSFMEIYNEELNDLLQCGERVPLRIYDAGHTNGLVGGATKGLAVKNLLEVPVQTLPDIYALLSTAAKKRKTAETSLNRKSSRSHSIFTITITMKEAALEGEDIIRIGKLNLVDLAGSENIQRSGTNQNKDRAKEAGIINQSLVALGRVINALTGPTTFVPYRDSKLTRLLQESLGGRTKTCIIATISPAVASAEETVSTLDYAHRAKNIKNRPEINQKVTQKYVLKEMSGEVERLKKELVLAREKSGEVNLTLEMYNELDTQATEYQSLKKAHFELQRTAEDLSIDLMESRERLLAMEQESQDLRDSLQERDKQLHQALISSDLLVTTLIPKLLILEFRSTKEAENFHLFSQSLRGLKSTLKLLQSARNDTLQDIESFEFYHRRCQELTRVGVSEKASQKLGANLKAATDIVREIGAYRNEDLKKYQAQVHAKGKAIINEISNSDGAVWNEARRNELDQIRRIFEQFIESTETSIDKFAEKEQENWKQLIDNAVIDPEQTELSVRKLLGIVQSLANARVIQRGALRSEFATLNNDRLSILNLITAFDALLEKHQTAARKDRKAWFERNEAENAKQRQEIANLFKRNQNLVSVATDNYTNTVKKLQSQLNEDLDRAFSAQSEANGELAAEGEKLLEDNWTQEHRNVLHDVEEVQKVQVTRQDLILQAEETAHRRADAWEMMEERICTDIPKQLLWRQNGFVQNFTAVREKLRDEALCALRGSLQEQNCFAKNLTTALKDCGSKVESELRGIVKGNEDINAATEKKEEEKLFPLMKSMESGIEELQESSRLLETALSNFSEDRFPPTRKSAIQNALETVRHAWLDNQWLNEEATGETRKPLTDADVFNRISTSATLEECADGDLCGLIHNNEADWVEIQQTGLGEDSSDRGEKLEKLDELVVKCVDHCSDPEYLRVYLAKFEESATRGFKILDGQNNEINEPEKIPPYPLGALD